MTGTLCWIRIGDESMSHKGHSAVKLSLTGLVCLASMFCAPGLSAQGVLTWHNDAARTGQNLTETLLSPSNVNSTNFGLLFSLSVDGKVDAEPLYVPSLTINSVPHNVLYVVTENDTVYAFDADAAGSPLWSTSVLGSNEIASDNRGCGNITPTIGILATPVIDLASGPHGTIYVAAMSKDNSGNYFQRLHAIDITTGAEQTGWPITVQATYPGNGPNSSGGILTFDPKQYMERAGLAISNGVVYTTWASHCDGDPYNGWVIGYNESTRAQVVLNLTPNGTSPQRGAIWMSGAAPAVDAGGNLYFLIGNGTFDTTLNANGFPNAGDYGNAFLNLSTSPTLAVADYFTMDATVSESGNDEDLGSGGATLLPVLNDAMGNPHELAVGAGKDGWAYVVDRNNMGKFNMNSNAVYQEFYLGNPVFSTPAWFNNTLYYGPIGSPIQAYPFSGGSFTNTTSPTSSSHSFGVNCSNTGATPSISANGLSYGIVWASDTPCDNTGTHQPAVLYAFDASTLTELYDSTQNTSENFGVGTTFPTLTVTNGKAYVGTSTGVAVFGLLNCTYGTNENIVTATTFTITVTAGSGCSWSAISNSSFIAITSGGSGSGNGVASFTLAPYSGASQSGTVIVAGQRFTITETGSGLLVPPPSSPSPANGSEGVAVSPTLSWTGSSGATSYDVYFGTSPTPPMVGNTTSTSYAPGTLVPGLTYYWMVVANNTGGSNNSPIWSFITTDATTASVTPNSGSGTSQTFTLQYSDTAGGMNLRQVWVYFNATLANPATNTCLLNYMIATNQISLLGDNGTTWQAATLGSSTTLQNSQCSINVATATVVSSGSTFTWNAPMTFKPAFAGAKNTYLYAVDISGTASGWQQLGAWTVGSAAGTPAPVSVTPNSGSGANHTFTLQYSDTSGAASLKQMWVYFNATLANPATNTCLLYYNAPSNQISLLGDSGTVWQAATLGSATTLQNSQCSVNVATATVVSSGNTVTWNVPMTFKPAFAGAKNTYLYAVDLSGSNSGWQPEGSWTVTGAAGTPAPVSVTPSSGSGASQTFTLQYSDTAGAASLEQVWVYFNATLANPATNTCLLYYNAANNQISLLGDNGTTWQMATLGSATTLQNSQCSVNVATATLVPSGNTLTWNVPMTFKPAFAGAKNTYLYAVDPSGNSGWQQEGSWTVSSSSGTPAAVSVTPNSGSGTSQTFALAYSDTAGAASLEQVWVYFNATLANPATNTCLLYYNAANNQISLLGDSGTVWQAATLGSATTLQNSQCSINVATATVVPSGNTLTWNVPMTFKPAFAGAKNTYMYAVDPSGNSGWQQEGAWTVTGGGAGTPTAVSVTPNSGSGASQTFALQYSDTAGAANLEQVWVYFNATLANPATNTCLLYYISATNQVGLLNDNGTTWQAATLGSATTLQNSQCSINLATTTVALSGNTFTWNAAMTFEPAYAGAQNTYLYAVDLSGSNSGWQQLGAWTVP